MQIFKLSILTLALLISSEINSQITKLSVDSAAAKELRYLTVKLQLSAEQQVEVLLAFKTLYLTLEKSRMDSLDRTSNIKRAQKKYDQSLKKIFSKNQFDQYMVLVEEQKKRFDTHRRKNVPKVVKLN